MTNGRKNRQIVSSDSEGEGIEHSGADPSGRGGVGGGADDEVSMQNVQKKRPMEALLQPVKRAKVEMVDGRELLAQDLRPIVLGSPVDRADREIVPIVSRQFWKAGDTALAPTEMPSISSGLDRSRVHPKFLHSNATSHKWALGAIAELLDNAIDEVPNGATFVDIDALKSPKDGRPMLLVADDGGGMTPEKMRQCMSFGYSEKSMKANTIGQYGNGFKTSTMRLGADCMVFSKTPAQDGKPATRSVGMLSYTFLQSTQQTDILVPMLDWEDIPENHSIKPILRGETGDFQSTLETMIKWGPYESEHELKNQFKKIQNQGTRVVVYNLWEDDQGTPELDFNYDQTDIQVSGLREQSRVEMAEKYPSSKYYISYTYSLRVYASFLYLRLPDNFRMILRNHEIEHYDMGQDLLYRQTRVYKPKGLPGGVEAYANVTLGFIKDAKHHIDVQGYNVYHKNRLIKPFWRIWNSPSSQGRGAVGLLQANFVEPAHNKQGFELTRFLKRLEDKLLGMQKEYWYSNCGKVGYHQSKAPTSSKPKPKKHDRTYLSPEKDKDKDDTEFESEDEDEEAGPSKTTTTRSAASAKGKEVAAEKVVTRSKGKEPAKATPSKDKEVAQKEQPVRALRSATKEKVAASKEREAAPAAKGKDAAVSKAKEATGKEAALSRVRASKGKEAAAEEAKRSSAKKAVRYLIKKKPITKIKELRRSTRREELLKKKALKKSTAQKAPAAAEEDEDESTDMEMDAEPNIYVDRHSADESMDNDDNNAGAEAGNEVDQRSSAAKDVEVPSSAPKPTAAARLPPVAESAPVLKNKLEEAEAKLQQAEAKLEEEKSRNSELETKLEHEKSRNDDLEAQLVNTEVSLSRLHDDLMKEHSYKAAVELELQERKKTLDDDEELRKQLKAALLRVRELEAEKAA